MYLLLINAYATWEENDTGCCGSHKTNNARPAHTDCINYAHVIILHDNQGHYHSKHAHYVCALHKLDGTNE